MGITTRISRDPLSDLHGSHFLIAKRPCLTKKPALIFYGDIFKGTGKHYKPKHSEINIRIVTVREKLNALSDMLWQDVERFATTGSNLCGGEGARSGETDIESV